jgi:glycosyltransferase involved in cell wall biosynthesis
VTPRLLVVISSLAAEGTPVLTLELCRRWRAMGIEPTVVSLSDAYRDLEAEFARDQISVRVMGFADTGRARYARMVGWMYATCRDVRPDALLSMPFGWHAFLALGARAAGVRSVVAHVGNYPSGGDSLAFSKFRWLVQAGRPLTRKLVCCSAYVARGVTDQFGIPESETEVIYNGADVHSIARRADAARNRQGGRARAIVGMVARLEMHKDQPTLIRAAKSLRDAGREIEVWLIGAGSRRVEYERLIAELGLSDTVKLLGMRRDIPELLGQLDVFAFAATPDEGQGVALVEAMAAGVPIVATDVGACREVLDEGELGALVAPHDPSALASAIESALGAREHATARVAHARAKAFSVFTIDSMARAYAETLRLAV